MNILTIDTSMEIGSVGLVSDGAVLADHRFEIKRGTTNTVHSFIEDIFKQAGILPASIKLVAVVIGPGSFTGLRVALAAGKGIAHPHSIPIAGVETTHAIAEMVERDGIIVPVIDAKRSQLYVAMFERTGGKLRANDVNRAIDVDKFEELIPSGAILCGSGIRKLADSVLTNYEVCTEDSWYPSIPVIASIALRLFEKKQFMDIENSAPLYCRAPDAKPSSGDNG
ncbi:MAG: tRNA (adenosine(37)-N6)-threonylcarbamoyltransferase complex dimerization subunit type 1 TsaB [candidate division Zixibacteria bacterium]|nr:tRNA (adenosine(37)-N6)-threonylcarbamoyltransferase complex dimerization subunit type 1 TsaB [candidate division Zixibacteria bacterium]